MQVVHAAQVIDKESARIGGKILVACGIYQQLRYREQGFVLIRVNDL
ncbi:MAG: hypothetical protein BWX80_03930 [Candidatus Hydrogenedentes bacterium ADurb.Bin101]|nr:MAG: hypothetical protein BWX80_03930 [Candidatus Hydrogenedentes bacterium ADurb.Bin101]